MKKKVLLIGLRSDAVDYDKWPQLTKEKLEAAFTQVISELTEHGFDARWCLTDAGATAEEQVSVALQQAQPDIVLIGAGVRTDADLTILFEKIINTVHADAPQAKLAFNSLPYDSLAAVQRWA